MFSVVIPIYNHAKFLRQAVESALRCPLADEVLLLDDGSSDGSAQMAAHLATAHPSRLRNVTPSDRHNRGAHHRLNELIRMAEQPWIAVLNSDDMFVPERFEKVIAEPTFTESDFVFGNILLMDERGTLRGAKLGPFDFGMCHQGHGICHQGHSDGGKMKALLRVENYVVSTSNMIFRKSLYDRVGGFSAFRYVHDWDFALRAMALGRPLYVPRFLTAYRVHSRNTIHEHPEKFDRERGAMLDRFKSEFP